MSAKEAMMKTKTEYALNEVELEEIEQESEFPMSIPRRLF